MAGTRKIRRPFPFFHSFIHSFFLSVFSSYFVLFFCFHVRRRKFEAVARRHAPISISKKKMSERNNKEKKSRNGGPVPETTHRKTTTTNVNIGTILIGQECDPVDTKRNGGTKKNMKKKREKKNTN